MKLVDLFLDVVEKDLVDRQRSITMARSLFNASHSSNREHLRRNLIITCYASWEGFVKFAAVQYLDFLTNAFRRGALSIGQLDSRSKTVYLLRGNKSAFNGSMGVVGKILFIEKLTSSPFRKSDICDTRDLVDTRGNLNTDTMQEVCAICGIKDEDYLLRRAVIDERLLKWRNAFAHGSRVEDIDDSGAVDVAENVRILLNTFNTDLTNKAVIISWSIK